MLSDWCGEGKPVRIEASSRREAPRGNDAGYVLPIRNLSKSCVDADIMHFFQGLDVTAVEVSTEPESGKCTGAARVRFGSKAAYEKALKYEGMMLLGKLSAGSCGKLASARIHELNALIKGGLYGSI